MVCPLNGLFEQVKNAGGVGAMYYGWEPLRDVSRPGSLKFAGYLNAYIEDATDASLTDRPEDTTIPMFFIGDDFTPGRDVRTL